MALKKKHSALSIVDETAEARGDQNGVSFVLWPQAERDSQLGLVVGMQESSNLDFISTWPRKCVSPIAQTLCIDRAAGGLGTLDDWPATGFAFDQNWNITAPNKGVYPAGSMYVDRYHDSWERDSPVSEF